MKIFMFNISNIDKSKFNKYLTYSLKQDEILGYYHFQDQIRSLYGELLSKVVISNERNIPINDIIIQKNAYGKPSILNKEIHFNISHSGTWVVLAASDFPVGIDIEEKKKININLIMKAFNENEINYIETKSSEFEKLEAFYRIWTRKESYLKALGIGLNTSNINFNTKPELAYTEIDDFYLKDYILEKHIMAVCSKVDPYDCLPIIIQECELYNFLMKGAQNERLKLL